MKVTVENDDGEIIVHKNVVAYDLIFSDDVQNIAVDYGTQLTESELKEFARRVDCRDDFPDYQGQINIVDDILEDRKYE